MHDKLKYKQSDLEDDLYTVKRDDNRSKTYPPHNEINACEKSRLELTICFGVCFSPRAIQGFSHISFSL
jgi:hypothetical protein